MHRERLETTSNLILIDTTAAQQQRNYNMHNTSYDIVNQSIRAELFNRYVDIVCTVMLQAGVCVDFPNPSSHTAPTKLVAQVSPAGDSCATCTLHSFYSVLLLHTTITGCLQCHVPSGACLHSPCKYHPLHFAAFFSFLVTMREGLVQTALLAFYIRRWPEPALTST